MSTEQLNEVKNEVQKILDHHLPEDQRFSIQDLDEEGTFLLIDLLLEKDDIKREKIWGELHKEIISKQKDTEIDIEKVLEIKDKLDEQKNTYMDVIDLKNKINSENYLNENLENI